MEVEVSENASTTTEVKMEIDSNAPVTVANDAATVDANSSPKEKEVLVLFQTTRLVL